MNHRLDADAVKAQVDIVDYALGHGCVVERRDGRGVFIKCPNPQHNGGRERTGSCHVLRDDQWFICFGCGAKGDVIEFAKMIDGSSFTEALTKVAEFAGMTAKGHHQNGNGIQQSTAKSISKPPQTAESLRKYMRSEGWIYKTEFYFGLERTNRQVRYEHHERVDPKTNRPEKTMRWEHRCADGKWYSGQGDEPLTLYVNGSFIRADPNTTIVSVEGPGLVDRMEGLQIPAVDHRHADVETVKVLTGRNIAVWPDADDAGDRYAETMIELSKPHAASISRVAPLVELGHGADVVDAVDQGWTREQILERISQAVVVQKAMEVKTVDLLAQQHNDVGNAQRLIAFRGADLRCCAEFRKWLVWDGKRWAVDRVSRARIFAQDTALELNRQAFAERDDAQKFARQSLDSRRLTAMLKEAEPHLSIVASQLDTNPWVLNFINGTMDLRTGVLRPHRREDLITKVVNFAYVATAQCPLFLKFLHRVMGASPDASETLLERAERMVSYLQKVFGYALTGITSEKVVFVVHGSGNNGKTTLLSLFLRLLDEYATLLLIETLMSRQETNNTQADLADLREARFVMTSETDEGQRLAEGKLKRITQGMGKIKAVRKYENPIEFAETHKLFLDCNHRPEIRGVDNAIWNRLHLIPFAEVISEDEIDRELPDKLLAEAEGVLAWAVEGTRRWRQEGLGKPPEVVAAAGEWRRDMDQINRFVTEACVRQSGISTGSRVLYSAYKTWAQENVGKFINENKFAERMKETKIPKNVTKNGAFYEGIVLLTDIER